MAKNQIEEKPQPAGAGDPPKSLMSKLRPHVGEMLRTLKAAIDGRPDAEGLTIAVGQLVQRLDLIVERLTKSP